MGVVNDFVKLLLGMADGLLLVRLHAVLTTPRFGFAQVVLDEK